MTRTARLAPVVVLLALVLPGTASAATIDVNTTADTLAAGQCSLRKAVSAADLNNAGPNGGCTPGSNSEPDTIVLDPDTYALGLVGPTDNSNGAGDIDIFNDNDLTIDGAGTGATTISGAGIDRIFDTGFLSNIEIRDMTLTNGHAPDGADGAAGTDNPGAGQPSFGMNGSTGKEGGAIYAAGTELTLTSVVISNCRAGDGGDGGAGQSAGSANPGQDAPNSAGGNGGVGGVGGAIFMWGGTELDAVDSRFTGNRAGNGGLGGDGGLTQDGADGGATGHNGGASIGGGGGDGGSGGAIFAIDNSIELTRVTIDNNDGGDGGNGGLASETGSGGSGSATGGNGGEAAGGSGGTGGAGAISTAAPSLSITDSRLTGNETGSGGDGADGGFGGGPGSGPTAGNGGDVPGGQGGDGGVGAAIVAGGFTVIMRTTIDGNSTGDGGDGGDSGATSGGGLADAGNGGTGGPIILAKGASGALTVTNSTLSGNSTGDGGTGGAGPTGGEGGDGGKDAGLVMNINAIGMLRHVTIASNVTGAGGAGSSAGAQGVGGAIRTSSGSSLTLRNSLVASNSAPQCAGPDAVIDGGRNLAFPAGSGCPAMLTSNPLLGPLADNGGDAPTRALLAGSPAIDAVSVPDGNCEDRDQREVFRPRGPACDIGAFESAAPSAATGGASGVTTTAAALAGTVSANTRPTTYRFAYGTTTGYGALTPPVSAGSGTAAVAAAASLAGLAPGTTYHYRLVARNSDGTANGTDRTFTTVALPPVAFAGLSILTKNVRADSKGRVSVNLRCPAAAVGNCKGKITLKARIKRKRVTLASARFSIAPGKSKRVRLKLSRKRRAQLRRAKKLKATLSVSAVDARGGKSRVKSGKLTLKAPKRKR